MKAFQEALVHDLDADGFADMYAQTIAYGLLSARICRPAQADGRRLRRHMVRSPTPSCKELMETFLKCRRAARQGGLAGHRLRRAGRLRGRRAAATRPTWRPCVRDFGDRNPQEDPVIHFYELFLKEYDAKKRMQRGVFYTPRPVVSYIVRSVHELLQTEFGLADGLADTTTWGEMLERHPGLKLPPLTDSPGETQTISPDEPFVQILDPATGTGTFLVEVIDVIHQTIVAKWKSQGHRRQADRRALERVCAEAPAAAPARLRADDGPLRHRTHEDRPQARRDRLPLRQRGARADLPDQRAGTVGEDSSRSSASKPSPTKPSAVNEIKRHKRFTVVIGNPPYSINSCNLQETAVALVEPFRYVDGEKIQERGALKIRDDTPRRLCEILGPTHPDSRNDSERNHQHDFQ